MKAEIVNRIYVIILNKTCLFCCTMNVPLAAAAGVVVYHAISTLFWEIYLMLPNSLLLQILMLLLGYRLRSYSPPAVLIGRTARLVLYIFDFLEFVKTIRHVCTDAVLDQSARYSSCRSLSFRWIRNLVLCPH